MGLLKRIVLLGVVLCVLGAGLLMTPGLAHAQTSNESVALVSHQSMQAYDHGYDYFFWAGWWGWGLCMSHETLQSLEWQGAGVGAAYATARLVWAGINGTVVKVAVAAFAGIFWTLNGFDQGNGVCVGWPYYLPAMPIPWSQ